MNRLLVTYDLIREPGNYAALFDAIKRQGQAVKILYSVWTVLTSKSCSQVRDALQPYIDANDKLAVVKVTDWATYGVSNAQSALAVP